MKAFILILLMVAIAALSSCGKETNTTFKSEYTDGTYTTTVERVINSENTTILYDSTIVSASDNSYIIHQTHNSID